MAFLHHRKLMMPDSNPLSNLVQACASVCHPPNNSQAALCTNKSCATFCPLICPPLIFPDIFSSPSPPPPYIPKTHSKLSLTLKISIALLVTTFSIFILYTLYKFSILWFRSRRNPGQDQIEEETDADDFLHQDHGPVLDHPIWYIRTIGLQPSVISAITILKYKRGEGLVEGTDCSICLSEFQEDETLRLLPKCSHAFHIPCIDTWLTSHTNCPLCRAGIVKNGEPNLSLPVLVAESSGQLEETRVGISENNGELEREREDGSSELRIESEDENDISKLEMGNSDNSVRRSVSMDCLSAARISAKIAKAQPFQSDRYLGSKLDKGNQSNSGGVPTRVESSCSIARSLQKGPDFIKRSFSCGGKVLFSRQSR